MDLIIMFLTPLEMLLVNLFVIHKCSEHKYNRVRTYASMGLFIVVVLYISYIFAKNAPGFGDGSGMFIFGGILFFIPVKLIYKMPGAKIITIACYSWSYTFLLFAVSVRLGHILAVPGWLLSANVLLTQTILYIITINSFYNMLKSRFIYILEHIGKKELIAFMWMSMMWFWTLFIINLSFLYPDLRAFQILAFLTLGVSILSSFRYIYLQVNSGQTIQILEKIAYHDELTQLRSRVVMNRDTEDLVSRQIPFYLIFFDLDNFKSINDRYGHRIGDQYLAFFAYEIKFRLGNHGGFYRISGDEFVCIIDEDEIDLFLDKIKSLPDSMPENEVEFLGFSFGIASFPQDGLTADMILHCADQRMYQMKLSHNLSREARAVNSQY